MFRFYAFFCLMMKNAPAPAAATTAMITKMIQIGNPPPLLPDDDSTTSTNQSEKCSVSKTATFFSESYERIIS